MKTIQAYVAEGIRNQTDLQDALYCAMRLEFSTIPPYLCAQWSIADGDVDGFVDSMMEMIVVQEMYHFALAGNMLSALGVAPSIDNADFLTAYPATELPGGIAMKLPVDLKRLTHDQVAVFMQIENPQFTPVPAPALVAAVQGPATIGDFYDTIRQAFTDLGAGLTFDPNARFVTGFGGETFPIKSAADAIKAIDQIKLEGEGAPTSPVQARAGELAHFYRFQELYNGRTRSDDPDNPNQPIAFPNSLPFARSTKTPSESLAFSQAFTQFLIGMKKSWTADARPNIPAMRNLEKLGKDLIKVGVEPEFVWAA
jgi:hypothetical protein